MIVRNQIGFPSLKQLFLQLVYNVCCYETDVNGCYIILWFGNCGLSLGSYGDRNRLRLFPSLTNARLTSICTATSLDRCGNIRYLTVRVILILLCVGVTTSITTFNLPIHSNTSSCSKFSPWFIFKHSSVWLGVLVCVSTLG